MRRRPNLRPNPHRPRPPRLQHPLPRLRRRRWVVPIGDILSGFESFMNGHRSAEFYFIPFSGHALLISSDPSTAAVTPRPSEEDEEGLSTLKNLRRWLGWFPPLRRALIGAALARLPEEDYVQDWLHVYASDRRRKFNEMEYHLPFEEGPKALAEIIDAHGLPQMTPHTITERHLLVAELANIRERGYAMDDEEIEPGLRCIAAAVRGHSGEVMAAISIAGPSSRLHREDLERHAERVVAAARQISTALGAPAVPGAPSRSLTA